MSKKTYKIIFSFCVGCGIAAVTAGCDKDVIDWNSDPFKNEAYINNIEAPISTFLDEQQGFEEYVKALRYSGMFNALNQSSSGTSFTAFVPNNDAMRDFYQRRGVDSLQQLSPEYMRQFVLYHTVKDSILPDAFIQKTSVQNLNNDVLTIEIDPEHAGQAILGGEGRIVEMGLSAYNGKVYVMSKAMTPLVETVYDRIVDGGQSGIMVQALQATGWDRKLATVADTTMNDQHKRVVTHYYYTLLNVSDATFLKAGISTLEQLKSQLRQDDRQGLSEDSLLREYVGYHILQNQYTTDELGAPSGSGVTRIWSSSAMNQVFTVTLDTLATDVSQRYTLNAQSEAARFVPSRSNILSKNGYVHELDGWLPVWEPEQTEVLWDFADYTDIKNIVDAQYYQPTEPTSTEMRFRVSDAKCFDYQMGEAGSNNRSYSDIDYVTCRQNMKEAHNYDRVVFNVGYMGRVSMPTPTIVRGKYRVELTIVYMTGNNFMRQQSDGNGGLLKMQFDEGDANATFTAPYTKVPSPLPGVYTSTIFEEVEFSVTASHQFSFVVLDPAASTNSNFSLQFDCVRFIPIE